MITDLTEYVRALGSTGEPPDGPTFDAAMELLRSELVRGLVRRGLFNAPPGFLGIVGGGRYWSQASIDELVLDCYEELFVHGLPSLANQLLERHDINGAITLRIRHFIHDRQHESHPLGYQLYGILKSRLEKLRDEGTLRFDAGGEKGKIRNATVCVFGSRPLPKSVPSLDLSPQVRVWNDQLWPGLIMARGRARTKVLEKLDDCLAGLPEAGVEAFRFQDLVGAWKRDVQGRWSEELKALAEEMIRQPDSRAELDFRRLRECLDEKVSRKEPPEQREQLWKLWRFLWTYAAGINPSRAAEKAEKAGKPPTDLGLEKELGIARYRLPGLKETLGRLIRDCQSAETMSAVSAKGAVSTPVGGASRQPAAGRPAGGGQEESDAMQAENPRERLRIATGEAAARWRAEREEIEREPRPPRPGDTFVCATPGDDLFEWLVLEEDLQTGRLLVVPGDDRAEAGSRDVAPGPEAAGVASIRCASGGWLAPEALRATSRTGTLAPEVLDQVRSRRAAIAAGARGSSLRAREVDDDPQYQNRMRELARIEAVLFAASPEPVAEVVPLRPRRRRGSSAGGLSRGLGRRFFATAATVLLVLGLGGGMIWQRSRLVSLERALSGAAHPNLPVAWLTAEERVRGEEDPLVLPPEARRLALLLEVTSPEIYPRYRVVVVTGDRRDQVWESDGLIKSGSEVSFDLPRALLTTGGYELRVYGLAAEGAAELLEEYALWIELQGAAPPPGPPGGDPG